jgi:hypothetical protein
MHGTRTTYSPIDSEEIELKIFKNRASSEDFPSEDVLYDPKKACREILTLKMGNLCVRFGYDDEKNCFEAEAYRIDHENRCLYHSLNLYAYRPGDSRPLFPVMQYNKLQYGIEVPASLSEELRNHLIIIRKSVENMSLAKLVNYVDFIHALD